ncbi:MAG: hypothetical protein ACUVS2_10540 [Candidatus Flexifilum sp.]
MIRRYLLPHLSALIVCALAVIWLTYPAIARLETDLIGHPFGDQREYVSLIVHYARAVADGASPFVLTEYLYPDGLDATLLWAIPLQSFPAWLLTLFLPPATAFNLTLLLFLTLNGWALFALAYHGLLRERPGRFLPALIGALIFTCAPAIQGQAGAAHIGLIALFPAPLLVLALLRQRDDGRRRWLIIGGMMAAASLWGSVLLLIYITLPIFLTLGLAALARHDGAHARRIALTALIGAACAAPFIVPFARSIDPRTADLGGAVRFSAPLAGILAPSFYHPLYAGLEYNRRALGIDPFEGASYIGLGALLMTLAARRARPARPWLIAAFAAWVLTLGPLLRLTDQPLRVRLDGYSTFIPLPYALIEGLPPFNLTRTPARFNLFIALAAAIISVYGAGVLLRTRLRAGLIALAVIIPLDARWFWDLPMTEASIPQAVYDLADRADVRAVFDVPWSHPLTDKDAMYLQTAHGHPILGGHVARATPLDPARGWLLETTLDPALLDAAGVDVVIVHRQWADAAGLLENRARQMLGEPLYEDDQIAIFAVPDVAAPALLRWRGRFDGRDLVIDLYARGRGWGSLRLPAPPCPRDPDPTLYCPPGE